MAFAPIALTIPQYDENPNWWLKFYVPGTTTPKVMAINGDVGGTQLAKAQLDAAGFPTTDGSTLFIPFIEDRFDLFLFPTEAEADANSTINALRLADDIFADAGGAIVIDKRNIAVVPGQLQYAYPVDVLNVSAVIVGNRTLQESDGDYTNDAVGLTITLSESLTGDEAMEFWASSIPAPTTTASTQAATFDFAATAAGSSLKNVGSFVTLDGLTIGDDFGGTFGLTGLTSVPKAGTIEIGSASVYDVDGRQFKLIGSDVRLETLGLAYSETAANTLSRITSLRGNGFNVDVSPRYTVTVFDKRESLQENNQLLSIHRGHAALYPENTMLALTSSYYSMAKNDNIVLELDLQVTSDGEIVVFHDDTVDADTNGTGTIASMTLSQVRALKFDKAVGTVYENECKIPLFSDVVQFAASRGVEIMPEIKQYRTTADIELMYNEIVASRMQDNTTWTSFQISDLQKMREYDTQSRMGWGADSWATTDLEDMRDLGGHVYVFQSIATFLANPTDVASFESYGLDMIAFTTSRQRDVGDLAAIGVRKIFSDYNM